MRHKAKNNKFAIILIVFLLLLGFLYIRSTANAPTQQNTMTGAPQGKKIAAKEYETAMFTFSYPMTYTITENPEGIYLVSSNPDTPSEQVKLKIITTGALPYEEEINLVRNNLTDAKEEKLTGGVLLSGTQVPGVMGGQARHNAVFSTKPNPTVIEFWGDNSDDLAAFNTIIYSFTSKQ